jgi:hypothetical protein
MQYQTVGDQLLSTGKDGEGGADALISGRYLDRMTKHTKKISCDSLWTKLFPTHEAWMSPSNV